MKPSKPSKAVHGNGMAAKEKKVSSPRKESVWSLYVLECEDGSLYTGISPDPLKRFEAHRRGRGARYTHLHPPKRILMTETVGSYALALRREYQIKHLHRREKLKFLENPKLYPMPTLADRWRKRPPRRRRQVGGQRKDLALGRSRPAA